MFRFGRAELLPAERVVELHRRLGAIAMTDEAKTDCGQIGWGAFFRPENTAAIRRRP